MGEIYIFQLSIVLVGGLVLMFAFSNGFRDSSTIIATVVSTRALSASKAFLLCALFEFIGAFFIGSAIALTIEKKIFTDVGVLGDFALLQVLGVGLFSAIAWGLVGWWRAWPISNNQALFAGLFGAAIASLGLDKVNLIVVIGIFVVLVASPLIGFIVSSFITYFLRRIGEKLTPKVKPLVNKLHVLSCLMVSSAHGSNDGQILMGLILLVFSISGPLGFQDLKDAPSLPIYIRLFVGVVLALGVLVGGQRLLKKMGMKFYSIKPTQGLGAQMSSAGTILTCASFGFPASAMQVITGSIVGAGVAKNPKSVRWPVAQEIVLSWLVTLPVVGLTSFSLCWLLQLATGSGV